ncbi:MAG TPA: molybdopterin-dependent oxidoreductase [Clostridia bacterium]
MHQFTKIVLVVILSAFAIGCGTSKPPVNPDTLQSLAAVQVKEYEGRNLSSILDFEENSIKGPQYVDIGSYRLKIDGLVAKPGDFKYEEVLDHTKYSKVVTLNCVEGWSVDILWEGILLKDLFDDVTPGSDANTVIFHSYDGYTTSLPLQTLLDGDMIIAYKMNGVVLPPERGYPFQLVAQNKLGYKWAKWITRIELSSDSRYQGYWEQRGYSNEANLTD